MGHKTFKRAQKVEPVWFTLPGPDAADPEIRFDCNDEMPAGLILSFAESTEGAATQGLPISSVKELFNGAIVPEQHEQFWALIADPAAKIGLSMLMDIAAWLAEEYSARPTGQSSGSTSPGTSSGNGSTDGALHAVSTYSRTETPAALTH